MSPEATDYWNRAQRALATAKQDLKDDPDAAASRAYYAAFHAVSALFSLDGKSFSRHSAVEAAVHRDLVKTGRWDPELGSDYSFLVRVRMTGDYGGENHVSPEHASDSIRKAKGILESVRSLASGGLPSRDD